MANINYLRFVTGIHFSKSELRAINSITFIYDPNWVFGMSEDVTFPIAFYGITGQHEVMESEVSKKQMLFYNDQNSVSPSSTTGSVLNVVADNIIIQPKTYKLDLILPYQTLGMLSTSHVLNIEQLSAVTSLLITGDVSNTITDHITPYLTLATPYINIIKGVIESLAGADFTNRETLIKSIMSAPDYNKNSLECMWRNRTILKMKMWNSWKYKYVVITQLDVSKEPTEDGVYRGSMTVQEVPILTMRNNTVAGSPSTQAVYNPALELAGNYVKAFMNAREQ